MKDEYNLNISPYVSSGALSNTNITGGSFTLYDGASYIYDSDSSGWTELSSDYQKNIEEVKSSLCESVFLFLPDREEYPRTMAGVINNYVEFLISKGYQSIPLVGAIEESETEDNKEESSEDRKPYNSLLGHIHTAGGQYRIGSIGGSHADTHAYRSVHSELAEAKLFLSSLDIFVAFTSKLKFEDMQKLRELYQEIVFTSRIAGHEM